MPETIRNRILAVALMAALVLVSISPATVLVQAQEVYVHDSRVVESTTTSDCAVTKHETVYVNLAADGAVQQVNVSDHLHTELPQVRIEDASDLSDITDVKTGETPERSNGRLFWQMDGTDLYYSGRSDSTPPMQFDIDYMINGVPIAPDQLAGKSGRLTIHVEAENTLVKPVTVNGVSYDLTCPMLLVGGDYEWFSERMEKDKGFLKSHPDVKLYPVADWESGEKLESAPHAQQILAMHMAEPVKPGYILRKKEG